MSIGKVPDAGTCIFLYSRPAADRFWRSSAIPFEGQIWDTASQVIC